MAVNGEIVNLEDLPFRCGMPCCPVCGAVVDFGWNTVECTECEWWGYG